MGTKKANHFLHWFLISAFCHEFACRVSSCHCLLCSLGVDILRRLRLMSITHNHPEKTGLPLTTLTTIPPPLTDPVSGYGVLLDSTSLYEAKAEDLFPPEIGEEFSVVISLRSWRANNAFLFSVKDGRDTLRFGIQLLPRRVVVYTAEKAPVYFTYDWQDGRQHPFAVGVRARSVSFFADCGAVQQREQTLGRSQALRDSGGLFTLGRMNSKAAPFNGRVCQLDIYPSAQAAAHYCNYLKTQCRQADTYRSPSVHHNLNFEVNDTPSNPSTKSFIGVTAVMDAHAKPTQYPTMSPSALPHFEQRSHTPNLDPPAHLSTSSVPPKSLSIPTQSVPGVNLDSPPNTTSKNVWTTEGNTSTVSQYFKNITMEDSNSGGLQIPDITQSPVVTVQQSQEGDNRNPTASTSHPHVVSQQTDQLVDINLRTSGTTLYRENQVESSERHGLDGSYGDLDMGGYDYGFEEPDFLYEYEDGFRGPKGEPGPMVSIPQITSYWKSHYLGFRAGRRNRILQLSHC